MAVIATSTSVFSIPKGKIIIPDKLRDKGVCRDVHVVFTEVDLKWKCGYGNFSKIFFLINLFFILTLYLSHYSNLKCYFSNLNIVYLAA